MKEEFITKNYFDVTFERFEKRFEGFSNLVVESFGHLNLKIDEVAQRAEERLGKRIDGLERRIDSFELRVDARFNEVNNRIDDLAETKVSRHEHKLLERRVEALENSPATA
jgi:hypothetical protein